MTTDLDLFRQLEPGVFPSSAMTGDETRPAGSWRAASGEFQQCFPRLDRLLSEARITPLRVDGVGFQLFAWGPRNESGMGWLSPGSPQSAPGDLFEDHRLLLRSFGGITERLNEPDSSWLLNHDDALTEAASREDASFVRDYSWPFEDQGLRIPIDLGQHYCIAREANGNRTLCHRENGDVLMFAPDHFLDHLVVLEGCPEYTLYRIKGARSFRNWVEELAGQWLGFVALVDARAP